MDRLSAMQAFVRVAEAGSFAAVAEQLGLARSAVTRQIAALERHLGVNLLARTTRRLSLTQEGLVYLAQCRDILDRLERADASVAAERQAARGLIRMTVPMSFGIRHFMPLAIEFARAHPDMAVDLELSERRIDLVEEGIDLGLRVADSLPPHQVARRLFASRFVVVASPDYLRAHGTPARPVDLRRHACLGYSLATRSHWQFQVEGELHAIETVGRFSADSGEALLQAALAGMGIALQPTFIAGDAVRSGALVHLLPAFPVPPKTAWLIFPGNRFVPNRVRQFADFLAERLGDGAGLPAWDAGLFD